MNSCCCESHYARVWYEQEDARMNLFAGMCLNFQAIGSNKAFNLNLVIHLTYIRDSRP